MMAGELGPDRGREGLHRAKQWLDLTTRVDRSWAYDDHPLAEMVHFEWPYAEGQAKPFSFDLGGNFRGQPLDGQSFLAESKKYAYESDLPDHFRDFLAKCYIALTQRPSRCDHFLWISWAPFRAQQWHKHATKDNVLKALAHEVNRTRALGVDSEKDALAKLDAALAGKVADRIWLITLGDKQEMLVPTKEHYYKMSEMFARERDASQ